MTMPVKHEVDLTWNAEPQAFAFEIYRHEIGKNNWTLEGTVSANSFKDTKVVGERTYVYEIYAVGPTGKKSAPSSSFTITTPSPVN